MTSLASLNAGIAKFPLLRWHAGASNSSQDCSRRILQNASGIVGEWELFDPLLRMCGNLISHPTEQFLKLLFVKKILLHRPCENSDTDIKELFSHLWKF